jgi:hypothetical protein
MRVSIFLPPGMSALELIEKLRQYEGILNLEVDLKDIPDAQTKVFRISNKMDGLVKAMLDVSTK